ncbi:MAG: hypothetical protein AAGL09_08755, partial [Pseudomonadota bacterium]
AGEYSISVTFFDESDGESVFDLLINDTVIGTVIMDQDGGGAGTQAENLRTVTFEGVDIPDGATLSIVATADDGERARLDVVEITPTGSVSSSKATADPVSTDTGLQIFDDVTFEPVKQVEMTDPPKMPVDVIHEPVKEVIEDTALSAEAGMPFVWPDRSVRVEDGNLISTDVADLLESAAFQDAFDLSALTQPKEANAIGQDTSRELNEGQALSAELALSVLDEWQSNGVMEFGPRLAEDPALDGITYQALDPYGETIHDREDPAYQLEVIEPDDTLDAEIEYMFSTEETWNDIS